MINHDDPAAAAPVEIEDPHAQLEANMERLRADADRARDDLLRARAELDNIRKRAQRDVENAHKYGVERLVEALLPVKDSLDLGLDAARDTQDFKSLLDGMQMTVQMFDAALLRIGVESIGEAGVKFDPEQHQAMMMEPSTSVDAGAVLRVLQKGYRLNERLVRPAMVVVAKAPENSAGS